MCKSLYCETWRRQAQAKMPIGNLGEGSGKEKGVVRMKKHNMMRVASALAVVTLLSTSLISGTLAKYTSTETSRDDSAKVASWKILAGTRPNNLEAISSGSNSNSFTFDLFNTVKDTKDGTDEKDIKEGSDNASIIAPGTWGYVDLKIKNDSEVNASYTIKLNSSNVNVPLQYAIKKSPSEDENYPTNGLTAGWSDGSGEDSLKVISAPEEDLTMTGEVTYRMYWKWDYDANTTTPPNNDTTFGVTAANGTVVTPSITATVTATQVD